MEDMDNISPLKKNILLVLPVILILFFGVTYFILPVYDERSVVAADVEKQNGDLLKARQEVLRLNVLIAENEAKKKELAKLEGQLPAEKEVSGLLKQVSDMGIKAGLDTVLWRPGAKTVHPSREIYEIPVSVEMRGNYHSFGYFCSKIAELPRIVNFNNISLKNMGKGPARGPAKLAISFSARTYSSLSDEEKKALEAAEKGKK